MKIAKAWFLLLVLLSTAAMAQTNKADGHDDAKKKKLTSKDAEILKENMQFMVFDEELGRERPARPDEITVHIEEGDRYIIRPYLEENAVRTDHIKVFNEKAEMVKIPLDRPIVIEYWTGSGMERNQFWNRMRELEREHEGSELIRVISIFYDTGEEPRAKIELAGKELKNYTKPQNLYYDLLDGVRTDLQPPGPVSYFLVDQRKQMTHVGRGDFPATAQLFDAIQNAINYYKDEKNNPTGLSVKRGSTN